jgi:hypothetical protein
VALDTRSATAALHVTLSTWRSESATSKDKQAATLVVVLFQSGAGRIAGRTYSSRTIVNYHPAPPVMRHGISLGRPFAKIHFTTSKGEGSCNR